MGGLINSAGNKSIKEEKPTLRILRSFPIFGKRTLMLYFPKSVGAGFSYLPLASLYDSHVSVAPVVGKAIEETVEHYEVRSSKRADAIIVMKTEAEAADVVRRLSAAIAPSRMKWFWWALGAVVLFVLLNSGGGGGGGAPSAPALSIHTPMVPRVAPAGASGPVTPAPSSVAPSAAAPSLPAPANMPTPKPADVNDPFGLKLAPEAAK